MHSFKDNEGRTWLLKIHTGSVRKCRALLGIDLPGLFDDGMARLSELITDEVKLADVLFFLCQDEAEKRQVTQDDFDAAFAGDVVQAASESFQEELVDFFRDPNRRAVLRKAIQKAKEVEAMGNEMSASELDKINIKALALKLIGSSGAMPESSESIPTLSASES